MASPSPATTATSLSSSESKDRKHAHGNAGARKMNSAVKQKRTTTHPARSPSQEERMKVKGFPAKPKVGMISLGCAKNLVDAEIMLGSVLERGMEITSNAEDADVLVINTCAFIDSAKEESIDAILEAHQQRGLHKRANQRLIVSGCMSQRFSEELRQQLPEVDAFIGLDQVRELGTIVERLVQKHRTPNTEHRTSNPDNSAFSVGRSVFDVDSDQNRQVLDFVTPRPTYIPDYDTPRFRLTPTHSAYLKI